MPARSSNLSRFYYFLTYQCHIPLAQEYYPDLFVLLALGALGVVLGFNSGGEPPAALAQGARIFALGIGVHLLVFARRSRKGLNFQRAPLLLAPWLLWGVLDWLFFAPAPWKAEESLIANAMAVAVFSIALHHAREPLLRWVIGGIIAAFVTIMTGISLGVQTHLFSWLTGTATNATFQPVLGTLGRPVTAGAVSLLVFFPCLGVALGLRWRHWPRILAVAACIVLFTGLLATAHVGVIAGLFTGTVLFALLLARGLATRAALILPAAFTLFLAAFLTPLDTGINRADYHAVRTAEAPLPRIGIQAALDKPLQGQGTGGFSNYFERARPDGWEDTPRSPGSLPIALAAESGLLGTALFLAPVLWLWFAILGACLAVPLRERRQKKPLTVRQEPPVNEERLFLATALAGSAAVAVALAVDYPGPVPAVACLLALLAGAAVRNLRAPSVPVPGAPWMEPALLAAAVAIPALWLAWSRAPLKAAAAADTAATALAPLLPDAGRRPYPLTESETLARLQFADSAARAAIFANPANGDAWNTLAATALRAYVAAPDHAAAFAATATLAATRAVALAPDNHAFHLTLAHALQMAGHEREALAEFETALRAAPRSAAAAAAIADALLRHGDDASEARAIGILREALLSHPRNEALRQRLNLLLLGRPDTN
jgi:tetratricopeptide (TPR) repeat protein